MATPEQSKLIAVTPYSRSDRYELPIRFAVGKYRKGTNPHDYVMGMQVNPEQGTPYFISTTHYNIESDAMNAMLKAIARHNNGHTDRWISYIPPTVKRM